MKWILMLVMTVSLSSFAQNPLKAIQKKSECEKCDQISALKKESEKDPKKAARNLGLWMQKAYFSDKKELRLKEMSDTMRLVAELFEFDDTGDIAAALNDMRKDHPEEIKAELAKLPESLRKSIVEKMDLAEKVLQSGETESP